MDITLLLDKRVKKFVVLILFSSGAIHTDRPGVQILKHMKKIFAIYEQLLSPVASSNKYF